MTIGQDIFMEMQANNGESLWELSRKKPVLLFFLRHFGCVFCKESLTDLANSRNAIEKAGIQFVFVHMSMPSVAERYFDKYELSGVLHISDPDQHYYREFGLSKGTFSQLYGLQTWFRGFSAENRQHKLELSKALGDHTQMPGIFMIDEGSIRDSYVHKRASDKPDYQQLISCCVSSFSMFFRRLAMSAIASRQNVQPK
ncbi:MAG: SelL-related redox protein, partial [Bacteroidota bacterium]